MVSTVAPARMIIASVKSGGSVKLININNNESNKNQVCTKYINSHTSSPLGVNSHKLQLVPNAINQIIQIQTHITTNNYHSEYTR